MALIALVRLSSALVAVLVLVWSLAFRSTFLLSSSLHPDHFYSVLHPLLMVIGFILLSGEAILAHRWLSERPRAERKSVHLALQAAALGFGLFGIWAKFKGSKGILANFYSLHSWMGLLCLLLFGSQWVVGFWSFWHRVESRRATTTLLPWHAFVGLYTYALAVGAAEAGLIEKLAVLQAKHGLHRRSRESALVNALGLSLVVLGGLVVLAAISPKRQRTSTGRDRNSKLLDSLRER